MTVSSKRAEYIALTGLILSVIFFVGALVLTVVTGAFAFWALGWQILGGGLIWFVLVILFHQRSLAEQEKLDMAQLSHDQKTGTIFQAGGDRTALFAVAQKRLEGMEKWFVPISAAVIGIYQVAMGVYLIRRIYRGIDLELRNPLLGEVLMVVIAFISFMVSRYATGMSSEIRWKPLRAGGSYLLGIAIMCFAVAICRGRLL